MKPIGSKERIRRFLKTRVGQVVTTEQIQEAVGPDVKGWARRLRELRLEGWQISSHKDRKDLGRGEYVLETNPPETEPGKARPPAAESPKMETVGGNPASAEMRVMAPPETDPPTAGADAAPDGIPREAPLRPSGGSETSPREFGKKTVQEPSGWKRLLALISGLFRFR